MTTLKLAAASKPCCCCKICSSALMGMDSLSPPIEMNAVAISVFYCVPVCNFSFLLCASVQLVFPFALLFILFLIILSYFLFSSFFLL